MAYQTTDIPKFTDESAYHRILRKVANRISALDGVEAIYQIGGISSPGISDLDMVVVFQNDFKCSYNIHDSLSEEEKYLFIHKLYGTSLDHFHESSRFSFFQNYSLIGGKEIIQNKIEDHGSADKVKTQIALEYMLKMYVNLTLQDTYKIIQARSLLLHGKALSYDVSYLGSSAARLSALVSDLLDIRKNWFESNSNTRRLSEWFRAIYMIYPEVLESVIREKGFYLDGNFSKKIARNISLIQSEKLQSSHKGFRFPAFPVNFLGKKYFRLMNRFNTFEFKVPYQAVEVPSELRDYFDFQSGQRNYNRNFLPHFYPLSSSLLA